MSEDKSILIDMGACIGRLSCLKQKFSPIHVGLIILQQSDLTEGFGYAPPMEVFVEGIDNLTRLRDSLNTIIDLYAEQEGGKA